MKTNKRWYHSVLDPEAKVIINFDENKILVRDKKMWEAYVSNTWINPPRKRKASDSE